MKHAISIMGTCLVIFIFGTLVAFANTQKETETYREITAPEVKELLEKGNTMVVHVLSRIEYEMQHISGSINIPITKMKSTAKLPEDKNTPIVFYCMGLR